jgi:Uma2 family endonuclease
MLLQLRQLNVPPGQHIILHDISWAEFERILVELGDRRSTKIAYQHGTIELMTPLPEHKTNKVIIGDFIKALLEELDLEFCSLGSTTFQHPLLDRGIEPDDCFYIKNEALIRGKLRLDLTIDPPPDLVLEIDITSRTHPDIYAALGVPELWRFDGNGQLQINLLEADKYIRSDFSPTFPNLDLVTILPDYLARSRQEGRNQLMKEFRRWIRAKAIELGSGTINGG